MIHLITGLGANQMAFSRIKGSLDHDMNFVEWIEVEDSDSLESYAHRIIESNNITSSDVLVGLSFGGLLAQQIASILGNAHIVLISSFRDKKDIKTLLRVLMETRAYKLIANIDLTYFSSVIRVFMSPSTAKGSGTLNRMIADTDLKFTRWAIDQIRLTGKIDPGQTTVHNIIGKQDKLIKYWENTSTFTIEKGGHFMIYENHLEVRMALQQILDQVETQ